MLDMNGRKINRQQRALLRELRSATRPLSSRRVAVTFDGAIEQCCPIVHQSSGRGQRLASWTDVDISFLIVGEGFARERPIGAGRLVEHGNVWLDRPLVDCLDIDDY